MTRLLGRGEARCGEVVGRCRAMRGQRGSPAHCFMGLILLSTDTASTSSHVTHASLPSSVPTGRSRAATRPVLSRDRIGTRVAYMIRRDPNQITVHPLIEIGSRPQRGMQCFSLSVPANDEEDPGHVTMATHHCLAVPSTPQTSTTTTKTTCKVTSPHSLPGQARHYGGMTRRYCTATAVLVDSTAAPCARPCRCVSSQ